MEEQAKDIRNPCVIFPKEYEELLRLKLEIDKNPEKWEIIKRIINPLEFASSEVAVAKVQPISRAFFKMIELVDKIGKLPDTPIRVLHLAESPGGFVQAWNWIRKPMGITDEVSAISIEKISYENTWKRILEVSHFWMSQPTFYTGDLLDKSVREKLYERYKEDKVWLVTGDGGFDFSEDYQNQESVALRLILSQMLIGLRTLEKGGCMILKIFDCFTLPSIQILWVYCNIFTNFRVVKPETSRVCNAEKYIVASGFKGNSSGLDKFLMDIEKILSVESVEISSKIETLFPEGVNSKWDTMNDAFKICFTNSIGGFIKNQINWIKNGIEMMKYPPIENTKIKTQNVIKWCRKYKIPINREYFSNHRLCLMSPVTPLPDIRNDRRERVQPVSLHPRRSLGD
jgi:23S rRNA U2552 (ribose-2'-O)-methylase RlmE/FtsJ